MAVFELLLCKCLYFSFLNIIHVPYTFACSAFCNPADVEAFTEEKGESLLVKCHGKGADFVRAVREIIESFEKLKNQNQVTNVHSSDEVTVTNASNSVESLADSEVMDEALKAKNKACPESKDSTKVKYDVNFPVEEAALTTQNDALDDMETPSEDPTGNMVVAETPQLTTSIKKHGVTQAQNFVAQKRVSSARRSRSSSRANSHKFHNYIMPSSNSKKRVGNVATYGLRDASSRSKRIRKSPDVSEANDLVSPDFASNGSLEENGSEIVTVDSDTLSFNEGSTIESGYGLVHPESVVECSEENAELSQRLDFKTNAIIVKKKGKPSRKCANNGTTELIGRLEKEPDSKIEMHKFGEISPGYLKNLNGNYSKEDGDEHLPLVKRARVRMGIPSGVREPDSSVQPEEKSSEVSDSWVRQVSEFIKYEEDSHVDRNPSVMVDLDNSSTLNKCPVTKQPLWEVKKQFGCSVDGEAALPPSKRLHRALEAMSANVAEDGQTTSKAPSSMKAVMNASCYSSVNDSLSTSFGNNAKSEFRLHKVDSASKNASQDCTSGYSHY